MSKPNPAPRIAIVYLRVSTEEQHLGPAAQRAQIAAWCARENVEIAAEYEEHVSGGASLDRRPVLMEAIGALADAGAVLLVVAKRDRLARDTLNAAMIERLAERSGAAIVSADGTGNGDSPEALLMRRMVDAFAEYEKAIIGARIKAALAVKAARGERTGSVPWGSRLAADGRTLERDAAEAEVEAAVHELRDAGLSYRRIAAKLAEDGHTSRTGRPFGPQQIARIAKRAAA